MTDKTDATALVIAEELNEWARDYAPTELATALATCAAVLLKNQNTRIAELEALQAAPPVPAGMVRVADLVSVGNRFYRGNWLSVEGVSELIDAALAAAPAQAVAAPEVADTEIDWDQLPEDAGERAMFDRNLHLYGGDPRIAIATSLSIWANTRANGSFARMCAVLANEVAKLHLAAPAQAMAVPTDAVAAALIRLDAIYRDEADVVEFKPRPDWLVTALRLAAAPAQEHATQLAGKDGEQDEGLAQAIDERDAAFEAVRNRLCGLQRYSFVLDDDGVVRRAQDRTGNWIEFDDAHELFDPVAVDAAIAAQAKEGA